MANQSQSFEAQMNAALKEFNQDVVEALNKTSEEISKEAVRKLKDGSPAKSGKYKTSWSRKVERPRVGSINITVYNKKYGWRTHLLEHGHLTRNKKGTYGRTPAEVHIAPVEEWVVDEVPKRIEKEIQK